MNFGGAVRVNKCAVLIALGLVFLLFLYTYQGKEDVNVNIIKVKDHNGIDERFQHLNSKFPLNSISLPSDSSKISLQKLLIASVDVAQKGTDTFAY